MMRDILWLSHEFMIHLKFKISFWYKFVPTSPPRHEGGAAILPLSPSYSLSLYTNLKLEETSAILLFHPCVVHVRNVSPGTGNTFATCSKDINKDQGFLPSPAPLFFKLVSNPSVSDEIWF